MTGIGIYSCNLQGKYFGISNTIPLNEDLRIFEMLAYDLVHVTTSDCTCVDLLDPL